MRLLFWLLSGAFLATAALSLALLVASRTSDDGVGIVFIFFLPLSCLSLALGFGAALVTLHGQALNRFERRIGRIVGFTALVGAVALILALALE